jgi:NAD(P)H dehydrogenase (quinone)
MKIAVVYHSGYGNTLKVAEAVVAGARSVEGTEVELILASEITEESPYWDFLDAADAHIYGTPTYMGTISAGLKAFFETRGFVTRWVQGTWANKIVGGFTNSASPSGDKFNTLVDLVTITMQMGMVWVGQALPPAGKHGGNIEDVNRLGSWIGPMTQSPQGEHDGPLAGDLEGARIYGKRIAESSLRWNK